MLSVEAVRQEGKNNHYRQSRIEPRFHLVFKIDCSICTAWARPRKPRHAVRLETDDPALARGVREQGKGEGAGRMSRVQAEDGASPIDVVRRFYQAESAYMNAGGPAGGASFQAMADTLDPEVILHQTPDLPWGGEYRGHDGYEDWAKKMSAAFDRLAVQDTQFLTVDDTVVILCRLVTRSRKNGKLLDLPMAQMVRTKAGKIVEFRPFYWNVPAYGLVV